MENCKRYLLACDERGTKHWPSKTKTWAIGGFIIPFNQQANLVQIWSDIKKELCGNENDELKWCHFFPGTHQSRIDNPLLATGASDWQKQTKWALQKVFTFPQIIPINILVRKDNDSKDVLHFSNVQKDRKILDFNVIWVGILGQFASFLHRENGFGEIWFDHLGSRKEEAKMQEDWDMLRNGEWKFNPENKAILSRIDQLIFFKDSKHEPMIQLADFISGAIWAASEGDDSFLLGVLSKYFPLGFRSNTLIHLE